MIILKLLTAYIKMFVWAAGELSLLIEPQNVCIQSIETAQKPKKSLFIKIFF
jgi:hypothetical protein